MHATAGDTSDWTAPGAYPIAEGVYRIPLPLPNDGLTSVNVYALTGDDDLVLIDAGWAVPEAAVALQRALQSIGFSLQSISRILVTHVHRDHYTQGVRLRRGVGARLSLGAGERASLEVAVRGDRRPMEPQILQVRRLGGEGLARALADRFKVRDDVEHVTWEMPDDWLTARNREGVPGRSLEVVPTPGHTRGHVVFHDLANKLIFTGDHVLPSITPSIGFEGAPLKDPLGSFLNSLALVRQRPDAIMLPAHGPPGGRVHQRVDQLLDHHGARLDATLAAVESGADTGYAVANELRWTRREKKLTELDLFNQMLAVCETGAHLTVLVAQGRIRKVRDDCIDRYSPI